MHNHCNRISRLIQHIYDSFEVKEMVTQSKQSRNQVHELILILRYTRLLDNHMN